MTEMFKFNCVEETGRCFSMQQCWADTRRPGARPPGLRPGEPVTSKLSSAAPAPALAHTDWITDYNTKTHLLSGDLLVQLYNVENVKYIVLLNKVLLVFNNLYNIMTIKIISTWTTC